jgi:hypothetical protein
MSDEITAPKIAWVTLTGLAAVCVGILMWMGGTLFTISTTVSEMRRDLLYIGRDITNIDKRVTVVEKKMEVVDRNDFILKQLQQELGSGRK